MEASVEIHKAGYAYVFLSNEGVTVQQIGFDNYIVTHEHSDVVQQDDYYPFGLTFNSYQRENSEENKMKFQGLGPHAIEAKLSSGLNLDKLNALKNPLSAGNLENITNINKG